MSDKTRLNILMLLAGGERNVTNLCELLALPQPTVSHHLGLLRMNNLIGNRRNGKQVFYTLNGRVDTTLSDILRISVGSLEVQVTLRSGAAATGSVPPAASNCTGDEDAAATTSDV